MSSPVPQTPGQLVASMRRVALVVVGVLVALAVVLVYFVLPESGVGLVGVAAGLLLGVVSVIAARVLGSLAAPMVVPDSPEAVLERVRAVAFTALAGAEGPAVLAFAVSVVSSDRGAYLVAAPLAVLALVREATGGAALRRHLAHLESAGVASGVRL